MLWNGESSKGTRRSGAGRGARSLVLSFVVSILIAMLCLEARHEPPSVRVWIKRGCSQNDVRRCSANTTWTIDEASGREAPAVQMELSCCSLDRFTDLQDAKQCLRNRHIVFMGDSVTRYQYLNLANYLESGEWWPDFLPYSELYYPWDSWINYYETTNSRLQGKEICDCFRNDSLSFETVVENRYYFDRRQNIRLSYIQIFKHDWGSKGHNITWLGDSTGGRLFPDNHSTESARNTNAYPIQKGCTPGQCSEKTHPVHWHQSIIEVLEGHVASLEPDIVVFNTGFWDRLPGRFDIARLAAAGQFAISKRKQSTVFFKTTTAKREGFPIIDDEFAQMIENYGWKIFDAGKITSDISRIEKPFQERYGDFLYWDDKHFFPQVYAGINQVFLNVICYND